MTVRFTDAWRLHGFQTLILENGHLRIVVLPEFGGKIWSIVSKKHDREMLWHHPRMPLCTAHYGATYDDWFVGGWDEIFPNDYPAKIDGETYPDHGEVWSLPGRWEILEQTDGVVSVVVEHQGIAVDTSLRKTLTLRELAAELHVHYDLTNNGRRPLSVQWKLHPALPLRPGAQLHLPARTVVADPDFSDGFAADSWA